MLLVESICSRMRSETLPALMEFKILKDSAKEV